MQTDRMLLPESKHLMSGEVSNQLVSSPTLLTKNKRIIQIISESNPPKLSPHQLILKQVDKTSSINKQLPMSGDVLRSLESTMAHSLKIARTIQPMLMNITLKLWLTQTIWKHPDKPVLPENKNLMSGEVSNQLVSSPMHFRKITKIIQKLLTNNTRKP